MRPMELSSIYAFQSIVTPEYEIPMTGHQMYHHQYSNNVYQNLPRATAFLGVGRQHLNTLSCISIYAAIGLASAFASVLAVTARYARASRASRILFKYVLAFFISFRETPRDGCSSSFRFHDTTPQGALDANTAN